MHSDVGRCIIKCSRSNLAHDSTKMRRGGPEGRGERGNIAQKPVRIVVYNLYP